ncbi:MAG: hypothetical protein M5U34_33595 [Chloroflexi bacterium]|nr:hypothetical protein [Chloroflexota bacterium]
MPKHTLQQAFTLRETNELVAIVGGGGKTSLMFALANSLPGRIVVTTTTRIFAAQMKLAAATVFFTAESAENAEFLMRVSENLDEFGQCLSDWRSGRASREGVWRSADAARTAIGAAGCGFCAGGGGRFAHETDQSAGRA